MTGSWGVYVEPGYMVVLPIDDIREHDKFSKDCECMPEVEVAGANLMIVHNAFDFRHVVEWLNGDDRERTA